MPGVGLVVKRILGHVHTRRRAGHTIMIVLHRDSLLQSLSSSRGARAIIVHAREAFDSA